MTEMKGFRFFFFFLFVWDLFFLCFLVLWPAAQQAHPGLRGWRGARPIAGTQRWERKQLLP